MEARIRSRRWLLWPALLALVVFANAVPSGFVYDDTIILGWLDTRRWDPEGFLGQTRGLTYAVHALDRALWGSWAPGYHLTNVLLHAGASVLAGYAAFLLAGSRRVGLACGLLFAVHPVHVEAVANVANRKDVLAMLCVLAGLCCWLRVRRPWLRYGGTFGFYVLGLYAKEVAAAMLPVMLVVAEGLFGREEASAWRRVRRAGLAVAPLALVAVAVALVFADDLAAYFEPASIARRTDGRIGDYGASLAASAGNLVDVFRLLVWPVRLAVDYPIVAWAPASPRALLGIGLLAGWLAAAVVAWRRAPLVSFGLLWAVVAYLPCSSVVPLHHILVAERYLYVPSFGVCLVAAWGLDRALVHASSARVRHVWIGAFGVLLGLAALRTVVRNGDWRDWPSLVAAADRDGIDTWRVHKSAGAWAVRQEEHAEAARRYARAVELRPGDPELWYWLGVSRHRCGDLEGALDAYREAVRLEPTSVRAHYNFGIALVAMQDLDGAIAELAEAVRLDPEYGLAHYNLGVALALQGNVNAALAALETSVRLEPGNAEGHLNLGALLEARGDRETALLAYRAAAFHGPKDPRTWSALGDLALAMGNEDEALAAYERRAALQPENVEAHSKLGSLLEQRGERGRAIACFETCYALRPGDAYFASKLAELREDR